MFSIPHTFANEDESYITIPALRRFAREKRKEDLKTTVDRPQLMEDIEKYANQSEENQAQISVPQSIPVSCWLHAADGNRRKRTSPLSWAVRSTGHCQITDAFYKEESEAGFKVKEEKGISVQN